MSKVQSIIFKKSKYNSNEARKWLKKHNYSPIKRVDKTINYLRYRIRAPSKKYNYFIKEITPSIKFVFMIKSF